MSRKFANTSLSRLRKVERRLDPPKPPPPAVFVRCVQDGAHIERLSAPQDEPIPRNVPVVLREIVDPAPDPDDSRDAGECFVRIIDRDGKVDPRSTPERPEPEPHELADDLPPDEPERRPKSKPRRKSAKERQREHARELFEDRTQKWADQTGRKKAKTQRGIDHTPSERGEFRQAVLEGRVRKTELLGSRPKTRR